MSQRFNYNFLATIKRLTYASNISTYSTVGSCYGFFSPVDQDANGIGIQTMGQAYQFQADGDTDIKPTDKLEIDSVEYYVRGVRKIDMKRQFFIDCQLELPIKNT